MVARTVCHRAAGLTIFLDITLITMTFGSTGDVHNVACCEFVSFNFAADFIITKRYIADFANEALRGRVSLFGVTDAWLIRQDFTHIAVAQLNCFVTIRFNGLDLHYNVGCYVNYSNGNKFAVIGEDLRHANFFA